MNPVLRNHVPALLLLAFLLPAASRAAAQNAVAVPTLDANRFIGPWQVIARYPIRRQKQCLGDEVAIFDFGDKKNSFLRVISCHIKDANSLSWNDAGKLDGTGKLRLNWIWPFKTKYWVLAADPGYNWLLMGTPNHKSLWILSKTTTLPPDTLAELEYKAAAQGFSRAKLVQIPQKLPTQAPVVNGTAPNKPATP
jgi:apolipoprotein D and lipocalin family protein